MDRLELATAEPGHYLVRSPSTTVYILDLASLRPRMMRSTVPGARTSRGWWDNRWAPLVSVESERPHGRGLIAVGSRIRWAADPGGSTDANEWWWISRQVTSIEQVSAEKLMDFLAARGASAEATKAVDGCDDETDEILRDPEAMASIDDGLADLKAGRVVPAEQVHATIEKSGQDEDERPSAVEASHKVLQDLDKDRSTSPPSRPSVKTVVAELNSQLGATLVAAMSGTRNSKEPYSWESGDTQPDEAAETRLRVTHELWHLLAAEESGDVARAFFIGSNPMLNDDTIITALREDRFREARAAVDAFISDN